MNSIMLLLLDTNVITGAPRIEYGEFEGEMKWALYNEDGEIYGYYADADHIYTAVTYEGNVPEDFYETVSWGKYLYVDGHLEINPNYQTPMHIRVAELEAALDDLLENVLPLVMMGGIE